MSRSPIDELKDGHLDLVLLANFVHQVVNPLNGVAGTLDNLVEGHVKEAHRQEQRMRAARAQLEQCISLIRNLAFLAQGFEKVSEEEKKIVVLPQVIIESAMFFQEDGKSKNIEIKLEDRITQNRVSGHPDLIRQVLMNIFDNCIKYCEPGYPVSVNQRIQAKSSMAVVEISCRPRYPLGAGDIERLCDLGFRGQNATKVVASGTGLGLYICKRIVEQVHGGKLIVQASRGNELTFLIKIPDGSIGSR